jgi:hypothetical protein
MKKILLLACLIGMTQTAALAQKYMTRTGKITFDATTPSSPEKIDARNNEVAAIVDAKTGDLVFQLQIKGFKFEKELMEEHFNEKYMESDKYPKSTFNGKITNPGDVNFSKDGSYNVTAAGKLSMHGSEQQVTVPGTIKVSGNKIMLTAKFKVKLDDYKVEVPKLVADKVAKEASITLEAELAQK